MDLSSIYFVLSFFPNALGFRKMGMKLLALMFTRAKKDRTAHIHNNNIFYDFLQCTRNKTILVIENQLNIDKFFFHSASHSTSYFKRDKRYLHSFSDNDNGRGIFNDTKNL